MKEWNVYLSGEIHSNWREQIKKQVSSQNLPIVFTSPVTDHELSDNCGVKILGSENDKFWHDHKGAKINTIRTRAAIKNADATVPNNKPQTIGTNTVTNSPSITHLQFTQEQTRGPFQT